MGGADKERHTVYTNSACEIERREYHMEADGSQELTRKDGMQMKPPVECISLAFGGCGGGSGWRLDRFDSVWYRQLWRFKPAMAMIDERLNFNQNGARSIFREVNRLISQALLPSSLSFSPTLSSAHDHFWHWHAIRLFPISTSPCSFSPPPPPYFLPTLLHISTTSQRNKTPLPCCTYYQALSYEGELEHQSAPSARLIPHSIILHKTMRWEESIQQTEAINSLLVSLPLC